MPFAAAFVQPSGAATPAAGEVPGAGRAGAPDAVAGGASVPEGLPLFDPDTLAHFRRILDALTLDEQMHAQALIGELTAAELRTWVHELKALSIEECVAKIRAVIGRVAGGHSTPRGNGHAGRLGDGGAS
jgi:hypothetical protein